jgi:hypothetical protein
MSMINDSEKLVSLAAARLIMFLDPSERQSGNLNLKKTLAVSAQRGDSTLNT